MCCEATLVVQLLLVLQLSISMIMVVIVVVRSSDTDSAGGVCQIAVLPAIPYGGYLTHGELTTWEITTNEIHENWKVLCCHTQ